MKEKQAENGREYGILGLGDNDGPCHNNTDHTSAEVVGAGWTKHNSGCHSRSCGASSSGRIRQIERRGGERRV